MSDNTSALGGFEAITQAITNNSPGSISSPGSEMPSMFAHDREPEKEEEETDEEIEETTEEEEFETEEETTEEEESDEDEEEEEEVEKVTTKSKKDKEESFSDFGEDEPELAAYLQERLNETLGWEGDEEDVPKTIEEVVAYLKDIVEENSAPKYASDDLKELDEYVKNGGDIRKYFSEVYGETDFNNIDLEQESNQEKVIKEHLKTKGYEASRINRMVNRYKDAGTLEEEAEDALELLVEFKGDKAEQLLKDQKNQKAAILEQQQKYVENVQQTIDGMSDIRGISVSSKEKKKLLDYIFKPSGDGRTQYQKDYLQNNKNLIESAYFTMQGDKLVDKVKQKATSDAARNLKKKLAEKGKRTKDQSSGRNSSNSYSSILGLASSQLRKPNNNFNN